MNRQDIIKNICRCPYCYASLSWHHRSALCDACRREFFQRNGKIYFSEPSPESTEEAAFLLSLLENKTPTSKMIHYIRKAVTSEYHPHDRLSQVLGRIVEVAVVVDCGSGNRRLSERAINVDLNPFENVDIVSDIKRLPFARGSVDIVILDTVLEHVKDPQRCVDEAHRVLKTGGQVICVTPFIFPYHSYPRHYWNFSEDGIRYLFRNFSHCSVEMDMGPTSALINLLSEYFALAFKGKYTKLYVVIKGLALLPIFLLRYMDYFWRHSEKAKRIAMCLFTLAEK